MKQFLIRLVRIYFGIGAVCGGLGLNDGGGHGDGLRDDRDDVHSFPGIPFGGGEIGVAGDGEVLNAEGLSQEDAVEGGETESPPAVEEGGDVGLGKAGLARKERAALSSEVDATPGLKAQAFV